LLQHLLYADPAERLVSDVDVLVPEAHFEAAIEALLADGFEPQKVGRSLIEVSLRSPKGLAVDLHRSLFSPARYKLSTSGVFQRSTLDARAFGVPVHIAHPHDTAAHLLGKFVSDHAVEAEFRLTELSRWAERTRIEPVAFAAHLHATGLGRAARYALQVGQRYVMGAFFDAVLRALPPDPVGVACVFAARRLMPQLHQTRWAPLPPHLLNASLPQAGVSLARSALNRLRHAPQVRRRGELDERWLAPLG
jgi:hypothetical protein